MKNKQVNYPKIKYWLIQNKINQNQLSKKTELSTNTINRLINTGSGSKSTIKLISLELGISVDELNELLKPIEVV
jgi:hypothetical protein